MVGAAVRGAAAGVARAIATGGRFDVAGVAECCAVDGGRGDADNVGAGASSSGSSGWCGRSATGGCSGASGIFTWPAAYWSRRIRERSGVRGELRPAEEACRARPKRSLIEVPETHEARAGHARGSPGRDAEHLAARRTTSRATRLRPRSPVHRPDKRPNGADVAAPAASAWYRRIERR